MSFVYRANTKRTWTLTAYNPDADTAKNLTSHTGSFVIHDRSAATSALLSGSVSITDAANGIFTFTVDQNDLDAVSHRIGEIRRGLLITFTFTDGSSDPLAVFDDAGNYSFPFSLEWGP